MAAYRLGLALSGGSIKGFAHLGVMSYMAEAGIQPEIIAGTSAGSIMGAFYASGYAPQEIYDLFSKVGFLKATSLALRDGGLFRTTSFHRLLKRNLPYKRLEQLPLPMRIVATDLDAGVEHVFTEGRLADIILASCTVPILFTPVIIDGHTYVDGGLFRNFPVTTIRQDCQTVIGVNLGPVQPHEGEHTMLSVANRSWELVFRQNAIPDCAACDYLLESPEVTRYGMFEVSAAESLMKIGYGLAKQELAPLVPSTNSNIKHEE